MSSARDIVNGALRKLGVLAGGREPRIQDREDALAALRGLYPYLITAGAFGRIYDAVPTADYTAGENERIFRNNSEVLQITLPELVREYDCGPLPYDMETAPYEYGSSYPFPNGMRPPRDGAVVSIIDAFTSQTITWIYDAQNKLWQAIDGLELDDVAPLSRRDPDGLKSLLAMQIADEFGAQIGAMTMQQANHFKQGLTHRYDMPEYGRSRGVRTVQSVGPTPPPNLPSLRFNASGNSMYLAIPFGPVSVPAGASLDFSNPSNSMYLPPLAA